jgi:hypothetical protein
MKAIMTWVVGVLCALGLHSVYAYDNGNALFYSQASQDQFAHLLLYKLLNKQDVGYYLEIGAGDPVNINNTYFFEKNYGWKGISIDISSQLEKGWHEKRQNPLLITDATRADYDAILSPFPRIIDYLSLDIDSEYDVVLRKIPFLNYVFKIITIEHDSYRFGDVYKEQERKILSSLGYYLLCPDVSLGRAMFEDWWIHPSGFAEPMLSLLMSLDLTAKEHSQLIKALHEIL